MVTNPKDPQPPQNRTFNPNEHLMQIKSGQSSKDYLPVQWRLVWFRSAFPHGTIETEMLHLDLDRETEEEVFVWSNEKRRSEKVVKRAKGFVVFKATVNDGVGGVATGTKTEKAASFSDYIEKAECVPLDSEILTRRGFKTYDQITVGEEVLAYDHMKDECVWTPLLRVVTYSQASVVRLHGKCFEVVCTPEHTWPVYYESTWSGKLYKYRNLKETNKLATSHRLILAAPAPGGKHPLTPRDAAILGWLLTDGSIRHNGNSVRSYICQSKQENVQIIRELVGVSAKETIHDVPSRTFPTGNTYDCLPQHRFLFSADETRRILDAAGIASSEDLPAMVPHYSQEARQAMLISMMLADGDQRGYFGKKRKPGVMEAWQILATLEGFALGAMTMSSTGEVPLQRMKKRRMLCASELQMEDAGMMPVWCPTTQYGTWIMRQNGRVMITGNTGSIGRALAALGYGTQFTGDEWNESHRIVDAPVDAQNGDSTTRQQNGTTTNQHASVSRQEGQQGAQKSGTSTQATRNTGRGDSQQNASTHSSAKPSKQDDSLTVRARGLYDLAIKKGKLKQGAAMDAWLTLCGDLVGTNIMAIEHLTASRLDTIEQKLQGVVAVAK